MIAIKDYWYELPVIQQSVLTELDQIEKQAALEEEAYEKHMLIFNGKLIDPKDYPCECDMECDGACYCDRQENNDSTLTVQEIKDECCACPCHTYAEAW